MGFKCYSVYIDTHIYKHGKKLDAKRSYNIRKKDSAKIFGKTKDELNREKKGKTRGYISMFKYL